MLSVETKRKIDNARDVLVGKIPNPQAQVEQITTALIYKFMDDMDDKSKTLGGKARFFVDEYEKYSWRTLLDPRIGGQERMNLYSEAVQKLSQNPALPQIFRDVFKDAFVPYRDPETLSLFLKEINWFDYHHSEELGNAYEYLLSIMGSQGDAGQFRTPRHIIDFIVEAVDPQKSETVLDPACGTAGFLISAYKHILGANDGLDDITGLPTDKESRLNPEERAKMLKNFTGYDISPEMVRLSLVNMYLHGFVQPRIEEYDSLTYEDHWQEDFDVILANPPFMTPKGGVRPHKKFQIQASRAEVLFVDYIAEHLRPNGRAGIVVPEGVIFQAGSSYKSLRKMLVEEAGLWAVVSLPAGVFNPYAGVKTSVLLLDKSLAKQCDEILFLDVKQDGYSLGAQRTPIEKDDFPEALKVLNKWKTNKKDESSLANWVSKEVIGINGDYNLSLNLYKTVVEIEHTRWPTDTLENLASKGEIEFLRGSGLSKSDIKKNGNKCIHYGELYTQYQPIIKEIVSRTDITGKVFSVSGDVLVPATTTADANGIAIARSLNEDGVILGGDINIIRTNNNTILGDYLCWLINYPLKKQLASYAKGANIIHLSNSDIKKLKIVIPPISAQKQLVDEIYSYQQVIDATRQIVDGWRPIFAVDHNWETVKMGDILKIDAQMVKDVKPFEDEPYMGGDNIISGKGEIKNVKSIKEKGMKGPMYRFSEGQILYNKIRPNLNKAAVATFDGYCSGDMYPISHSEDIDTKYLLYYLLSKQFLDDIKAHYNRARIPKLNREQLYGTDIPLPDLETQRRIASEITTEKKLIDSSSQLADIFSRKIQAKIAEVWSR